MMGSIIARQLSVNEWGCAMSRPTVSLAQLNGADRAAFVEMVGFAFEDSPWIAAAGWQRRPFASLDALHQALCTVMYTADPAQQLALIRAHPDLVGRAALAGSLGPESAREQALAGLDRLSAEEIATFQRLNAEYQAKFGFPFVICARENKKESILAGIVSRLPHSPDQEIATALAEIAKIAYLRLRDVVVDDGVVQIVLRSGSYGKSEVRLVKVRREPGQHLIWDLNVAVALEGDFAAAYERGDNTDLLATDTMRNVIYALAKDHPFDSSESYGLALARHFLTAGPRVKRARVRIVEYPWERLQVAGKGHEHTFVRGSGDGIAIVTASADEVEVQAGIDNVLILKTTNSGWEGYLHDAYTNLPETNDRILATVLSATWTYASAEGIDFARSWMGIRETILAAFSDHYSPSVQNTLYRMGKAVLEAFPQVRQIHFSLPNRHHLRFDLTPFGLENANEIFHATSEPFGLIEGTVTRK